MSNLQQSWIIMTTIWKKKLSIIINYYPWNPGARCIVIDATSMKNTNQRLFFAIPCNIKLHGISMSSFSYIQVAIYNFTDNGLKIGKKCEHETVSVVLLLV